MTSARHARLALPPGRSLLAAVTDALAALGWRSATLQLLGGPLAEAVYVCSELTPAGPRWIDYGPPRQPRPPCTLLMGCATFGETAAGHPILHAHAVLAGADGVVGGHLLPDRCQIGDAPIIAHAVSTTSSLFRIQHDQATGFDLLAPA